MIGVVTPTAATPADRRPRVLVLNGPNLDLLGRREPEVYGTATLADLEAGVRAAAADLGLDVDVRQSNHEGVLVEAVHEVMDDFDALVINPAAHTHTSLALGDALAALPGHVVVVEVHLSNVHAREAFRHHSYVSPHATAVIAGAGPHGYRLALDLVASRLGPRSLPA